MEPGKDLRWYMDEDTGKGDITTNILLGNEEPEVKAVITANEGCVVAGLDEAEEIFREMNLQVMRKILDGEQISAGTEVMTVQGGARGILGAERVALNFIMRMSGIATQTRRLVKMCRRKNPKIKIAATRKTVPGFRYYDKKAVALGWGVTHRFRLDDMVLIKDNHLKLVPSITRAVHKVKSSGYLGKVEVEAEGSTQAVEAAKAGADIVMLDNFSPPEAARAYRALKKVSKDIEVEVSGGISASNILQYAKHADVISLGSLTHSTKAVNFSLTVLQVVEDEEAGKAKALAYEMVKSLTEEMAREHSAKKRQRL